MSNSSDYDGRSTQTLVEAGEVLRTLDPPTLASFVFLDSNDSYIQQDIADTIGCSRSSVSKYLQSLEALPLALATKQGQRYKLTSAGKKIANHLEGIFSRSDIDVDLYSVNWQSDTEYEQVASLLKPLSGSQSMIPFFTLDSIGIQSAIGEQIDLLGKPETVSIEDVIQDVTARQQERSERVTSRQIRQTVWRFDDADSIEFDGSRITLRDKGHEHAYLLQHVAQLLAKQEKETNDTDEDIMMTAPETTTESVDANDSPRSAPNDRIHEINGIPGQTYEQGYFGRQSSVTNRVDTQAGCSVVPAYCLRTPDGADIDGESNSHPPVVLIRELTTGEMTDQSRRLMQEYGDDTELVPYWVMQREGKLYPVGPMETHTRGVGDNQ